MRALSVLTFQTLDGVMQSPATLDENPSNGFDRGGWAAPYWEDAMHLARKYVVAGPDLVVDWANTVKISGDIAEQITHLKSDSGAPVQVHGSAQLIQFLHDAGLIDEYRLMTFPVVLGTG